MKMAPIEVGAYTFAKFLGVSPAYISQIFSQKRVLSDERAKDFSKKFKWPSKKRKLFLALIQYERSKDLQVKQDFLDYRFQNMR